MIFRVLMDLAHFHFVFKISPFTRIDYIVATKLSDKVSLPSKKALKNTKTPLHISNFLFWLCPIFRLNYIREFRLIEVYSGYKWKNQ